MPPPNPQKNSVQVIKPGDKLPVVKATLKPGEMPEKKPDDNWVPPAATAWETYAGNGEPFLSSLGSMVIHGLVILVIVTGVLSIFNRSRPVEVDLEPVEIGNGFEGGGGGNTQGVGLAPGNLTAKDEVRALDKTNDPLKDLPMDDPMVKKSTGPTIDEDTDIVAKIQSKAPKVGPILKDAMEGLAGFGKGGPGRGGGEGSGVGTGRGSGEGPGTGRTTKRGQRVLRWQLLFPSVNSGEDYVRQLNSLDMALAVPDPTGHLLLVKNPFQPGNLGAERVDPKSLMKVYFIDEKRESCEQIQQYWRLDFLPSALIAFMPLKFEEELVKKETSFLGRREEDIKSTLFEITFSGGKHVIRVREQIPKAGRR